MNYKSRFKTKRIFVIGILLIIGCSTPYQPKGVLGGYTTHHLGGENYRITFRGNQHTEADMVFDYLLFRCAEVAVDNDYKYFVVYNDSSYLEYTVFIDDPNEGENPAFFRKWVGEYLISKNEDYSDKSMQLLNPNKIKDKYDIRFNTNLSINIIGVFKIQLFNEQFNEYEKYIFNSDEIIEKLDIKN